MAPKRQPSKQKRAAQNRNQRAALAARAANAKAAPAGTASRESAPSSGGGSLLSRLRGGGTAAGATRTTTGSGRAARTVPDQPPGYRAALSAIFAAVAAALLCTFALRYPVDANGDLYTPETLSADWSITALHAAIDQPDATPAELADSIETWAPGRSKDTVVKALWPYSLAIVFPLGGAALAFHSVRRRSPSKTVNRALYATLFGAVLTQGLMLLFLPVVVGVGVAMFQVRKAEVAAAAAGGAGDVVDVNEVDDEEAEAEDLATDVLDEDAEDALLEADDLEAEEVEEAETERPSAGGAAADQA